MWLAVCSSALQLQFAKDIKPLLCIVDQSNPPPVHKWFSLTREGLGRVIPGDEGPGKGIKVWRREVFGLQWYWTYQGLSVVPI